MASRWPTVILAAFTAAGGYITGDWVSERESNANLRAALSTSEKALDRAAKAERRMVNLEHQLAKQKDEFDAAVDSSDLDNCRLPDPAVRVLDDLSERAANPRMPGFPVR